ncbi:MAG: DUF412 domain-containing protein [Chromatiaceae bacterium]|nr:DUF412 domain-containing protein [Chromatiaceae bacterium]
MQYPLYATVKAGREYSKVWPAKPELNGIFVENKVILFTTLSSKLLPLTALLVALLQFWYLGNEHLGHIVASMLFVASVPLQGWYWLGVRAATPLPPSVASWYQQVREKMQQQGIELKPLSQPWRYEDLAALLQKAYQQLDKSFVSQWL